MRTALVLLMLAFQAGCATGGRMQRVDALMQRYDGRVPGASLLVVRERRAGRAAQLRHG